MQKLYFLPALIAMLFLGTLSAQAQRSVNMQTSMLAPVNNQQVTIGTPFNFRVEFKNLGPDSLKPADTLYYTFTGAGNTVYFRTGMTKKMGDTVLVNTNLTFSSASSSSIRFCVYSLTSGPAVVDPTRSNDSSCIASLKINSKAGVNTVVVMGSDPVIQQLTAFPNPASAEIELDYTSVNSSAITARVLDLAGRTVMVREFSDSYVGKHGFKLDVSSLRRGLYFVELRQDNIRALGKITKD